MSNEHNKELHRAAMKQMQERQAFRTEDHIGEWFGEACIALNNKREDLEKHMINWHETKDLNHVFWAVNVLRQFSLKLDTLSRITNELSFLRGQLSEKDKDDG